MSIDERIESVDQLSSLLWDIHSLERRIENSKLTIEQYTGVFDSIAKEWTRKQKSMETLIAVKELRVELLKQKI